jgi:drug/metabolite transporter (DMT)-like permease
MFNIFLLVVSIFSGVSINGLHNSFGKTGRTKSRADINYYNTVSFLACVVIFTVAAVIVGKISVFTVLMGLLFGILTVLTTFCKLSAFSKGPMHVTNLIITTSMLIPTLSGPILFPDSEKFSIPKLIFAAILIFFIYLLAKNDGGETSVKKGWIPMMAVAFVCCGFVGVMQKIHQSSEHKGELFAFLAVAFAFSAVVAAFVSRGNTCREYFKKSTYGAALLCGVCTFAMHFINLKLSGEIPTQIFFPAYNGSVVIGTTLVAVLIFKEKLTARHLVGMIGAFLCLLAIALI